METSSECVIVIVIIAIMRQDDTPTAALVWSTFQRSWRHYFGTPDVMSTDGGPEFRGDLAQSGEHAGIFAGSRRRGRALAEW